MTPTFTFATIDDLPDIVRIYNQTVPTRQSTADLEPVSVDDRREWFAGHNHEHRPLWLIKLDDVTAGWISLTDFYGREAYKHTVEVSIYIDENYRGHHLGNAALTFVEQHVNELDIQTILAYIFGHNTPSLGLFKKFGYQEWAHLPEVAEMDGVKRDLDILGKKF
ncbi:N-acetyltransferase family protein [Paucilactobacillus suebicus]|uniref:Sortase related acyltransferase n=1 Tax=Paucilactobacillus suebicus DSM 5007 = KCTC 3549 TaxID=1423807 RepID=A0A0R1W2P9_9LACO|nr:GNAT family N-acetyltransferase [Paucilactobacillus suebicus]KRM11975.1 sortase related acyltransferase [Paucilactobacillus suebicus DSM 5007 = KCTC 3549]